MSDRPSLDAFPHRRRLSTRWADNDVYGHVNNAIYYQYFDSVINSHLIDVGGLDFRGGEAVAFIVRSECDYFAPVAFPTDLDIGMAVSKLGNSSVTYLLGLFKPGDAIASAVGRMVHVFVASATHRPVPIPPTIRAALEPLVRVVD
jgi:acyl-CoA thioester hydrolase